MSETITGQDLDGSVTVNQVLQLFPAAVTTFALRGIDTCCRGNDSLAVAAANAGVDLDALIRAIGSAAPSDTPVASACGCSSARNA